MLKRQGLYAPTKRVRGFKEMDIMGGIPQRPEGRDTRATAPYNSNTLRLKERHENNSC